MAATEINVNGESSLKNFVAFAEAIEYKLKTPQEVVSLYDKWSPNYENDERLAGYSLHSSTVDLLENVMKNEKIGKDAYILDLAAGTGLVGKELRNRGFTGNIDAHDGSQKMLALAKKLPGVYKNFFCHIIEPNSSMPESLASAAYDAVTMCGTLLLPSLIHYDCLKHFINSVRVGGLIVFTIKHPTKLEVFNFNTDLQREAFRLETMGVWKLMDIKYDGSYRKGFEELKENENACSILYCYKKTKNL